MDPTFESYAKVVAAGQLRHLLTGTGAGIIVSGIASANGLNADSLANVGAGAAVYVLGAGWSWWQKSGSALAAAQLKRLTSHVAAIPVVPSNLPQAAAVNAAVETAKIIAKVPDAVISAAPAPAPRAQGM